MLKEREYVIQKISIILQVLLSIGCFALVWWSLSSPGEMPAESVNELKNSMVFVGLLWFLLLDQFGLGNMVRTASYFRLFITYFKLVSMGIIFLIAINMATRYSTLEFTNLFYFGLLNLFVLSSYNNVYFTLMRFFRRRGYNIRQILVIADEESTEYIEKIIHTKDWGIRDMDDCVAH